MVLERAQAEQDRRNWKPAYDRRLRNTCNKVKK